MATQKFKLAINNARFPFLYSRASRTVLQPGLDIAPRTSVAFVGGVESFDYNLVQLIYAENVLPTAEGITSVGFQEGIEPRIPAVTDFDQLITLRDSVERNYVFSPARGKNYVLNATTRLWTSHNSFVWSGARTLVTRAYVNGRTFIFYEGDRLIEWDPVGSVFNTRVLTLPTGYTLANIRGCAGASNYLLLFTDTEILWCSLLDVLNFNDPIGKSGRQTPIDLKGQITCCIPIAGGFIVYTTRNAVASFFTNNADLPFSFREVQDSGGVASYEQITSDTNPAEHYTYGSSGLQQVNLQRATSIHPDCSDFLAGRQIESWNPATKSVDETLVTADLDVKLQYLASRYLIISYGKVAGQFTFALIYDTALRRWGKVKVTHVDVSLMPYDIVVGLYLRIFELANPIASYTQAINDLFSRYASIIPLRAGFAFLQNTGALQILVSDASASLGSGVAVFGHVQILRSRIVTFQGVVLDGMYAVPAPAVSILGSLPGNGYARDGVLQPVMTDSKPRQVTFKGRATYENFDVAIEGRFQLSAGIVETSIHGAK